MSMKTQLHTDRLSRSIIASFLLTASLAGCGGGGSATNSLETPVPVASPTAATSVAKPIATPAVTVAPGGTVTSAVTVAPTAGQDLVTSVTPPTYLAGSVEKGAWDVLIHERQACGFGLLQQDTRLDAASAAHSYYLTQNSLDNKYFFSGHNENPNDHYFSGTNGLERAVTKGVSRIGGMSIDEIIDELNVVRSAGRSEFFPSSEARGATSMKRLMGTVYHLSGALYAGRVGGVGSSHLSGPFDASTTMEVYRFGALIGDIVGSNTQRLGSGNLATYPCASASPSAMFAPATEGPNPFPEITSTSVMLGTPIYFKADEGSVVVVSTATVTRVSDGTLQPVRQLNRANDAAAKIGANEVFLVPTSALVAATSYQVNAVGSVNGIPFTRNFTFTTAP